MTITFHRPTIIEVPMNRWVIDQITTLAGAAPWPGRTGPTDQRVLLNILAIAWESGTLSPTASSRQIGLRAGHHRETVELSIARLQPHWLGKPRPQRGQKAAIIPIVPHQIPEISPLSAREDTYSTSIRIDSTLVPLSTVVLNGEISGKLIQTASPDLFRAGGLSDADLQIFATLDEGSRSIAWLHRRTGRSQSQIYASLKRLSEVELTFPLFGGWTRLVLPVEELRERQDQIAAVLGLAGETLRQRERYEQEHAEYRYWLRTSEQGSTVRYLAAEKRFAAYPLDVQEYASELAKRALEHHADLGLLPPTTFAEMRRRAFRLVIEAKKPPYEDFEKLALYIAK